MLSVLFVCSGNICRSPALEAIFKSLVKEKGLSDQIFVDSCGVHSLFLNSKADPMIVEAAAKRGIKIESRAKLMKEENFKNFDYIFVVDNFLLEMLKSLALTKKMAEKVHLATEFSKQFSNKEIPDPYQGPEEAFTKTLDMAEDACIGILKYLERNP